MTRKRLLTRGGLLLMLCAITLVAWCTLSPSQTKGETVEVPTDATPIITWQVVCPQCTIQVFVMSHYKENTLVVYHQKEAVIIDPGNSNDNENNALQQFITDNNLKVTAIINTHPHLDHVVGNEFCKTTFEAPLLASDKGSGLYRMQTLVSKKMGFPPVDFINADQYIEEGDTISFCQSQWQIFDCSGHANGSIVLYSPENEVVIVGDALFKGSVGRTDLPTGDPELLITNIKEKLLTLPPNTLVIPGHGPTTTIGEEMKSNRFLQ